MFFAAVSVSPVLFISEFAWIPLCFLRAPVPHLSFCFQDHAVASHLVLQHPRSYSRNSGGENCDNQRAPPFGRGLFFSLQFNISISICLLAFAKDEVLPSRSEFCLPFLLFKFQSKPLEAQLSVVDGRLAERAEPFDEP